MFVRWQLVDDSRHRVDALRRSIHALEAQRALVFLNFARRLDDTCSKLAARGMQARACSAALQGDARVGGGRGDKKQGCVTE